MPHFGAIHIMNGKTDVFKNKCVIFSVGIKVKFPHQIGKYFQKYILMIVSNSRQKMEAQTTLNLNNIHATNHKY